METWSPQDYWNPPPICIHLEARGQKLEKADRIFHGSVGPFISEKAVEALRPFLVREGHVLPLKVCNNEEKYFLWWVPWIESSVNLEKSQKFQNGKTIKRYAFDEEKIKGLTAFRPHYPGIYNPNAQGQVIVSKEFKKAWLDAGLTGVRFRQAC